MKNAVRYKKISLILIVAAAITMGAVAMKPAPPGFKNLKILPQHIAKPQLDSLMHLYNKALNVSCSFCHSKKNDSTGVPANAKVPLDFSLDNNMKDEARKMMRMTMELNAGYFNHDSSIAQKNTWLLNTVSCNTCHRGNPYPANE